jgi:hypothetical protein
LKIFDGQKERPTFLCPKRNLPLLLWAKVPVHGTWIALANPHGTNQRQLALLVALVQVRENKCSAQNALLDLSRSDGCSWSTTQAKKEVR